MSTVDKESWSLGDHDPDGPFGCPHDFGPMLGFRGLPDMRVHICNLNERHSGPHRCKCGASAGGEVQS